MDVPRSPPATRSRWQVVILGAMVVVGAILLATVVNVLFFQSGDDSTQASETPPTAELSPSAPAGAAPTEDSPSSSECLTADEFRTGLFTNWEAFRQRPGAEVVEAPDGAPEVIIHHADGSDLRVTWGEFTEMAKAAARACRADSG